MTETERALHVHIATQQRAFEVQRLELNRARAQAEYFERELAKAQRKMLNMRNQLRHLSRVLRERSLVRVGEG